LRKHIDRLTLRLAAINIDIELLDFYHDPSGKAIVRAKRTLVALGALTKSGEITGIGRAMEKFPVSSSYARMLIEAENFSKSVQRKLAAIIAIQEVGGIVKGGSRYTGWRKFVRQSRSDLLAEYEVYLALPSIDEAEYEELGIIGKNAVKASEVMERLQRDLGLNSVSDEPLTPIDSDEQDPLMRSIVAGQIDQLWAIDDRGDAVHIQTSKSRELSSSTVVRSPRLIAGTPFDLQVPTRGGDLETLHLVNGITSVKTEWLLSLAPESFRGSRTKTVYDPYIRGLAERQQVRFGKQVLYGESVPVLKDSPSNRRAFRDGFADWAHAQLQKQAQAQGRFKRKRPPVASINQLRHQVEQIANDIINIDQLDKPHRKQLLALAESSTHGHENHRDNGAGHQSKHTKRRSGWKAPHKRKFNRRRD